MTRPGWRPRATCAASSRSRSARCSTAPPSSCRPRRPSATWPGASRSTTWADPGSLALMTLLRPDVIKLDMRVVQEQPAGDVAEVVAAVNAHAEETGALVLAEGIEHEDHLRPRSRWAPPWVRASTSAGRRPSPPGRRRQGHPSASSARVPPRRAPRRSAWSAPGAHCGAGISSSSAPSRSTSPARRGPWCRRASSSPASGRGRLTCRAPALADLLAPHFAALISACSLGRGGDAYEFAVSYERTLVVGCARALVSRLRPLD